MALSIIALLVLALEADTFNEGQLVVGVRKLLRLGIIIGSDWRYGQRSSVTLIFVSVIFHVPFLAAGFVQAWHIEQSIIAILVPSVLG